MASAMVARESVATGNQSFASMLCRGRVLSQASVSLPSLTKQETESVCGGKGGNKVLWGALNFRAHLSGSENLWIPSQTTKENVFS